MSDAIAGSRAGRTDSKYVRTYVVRTYVRTSYLCLLFRASGAYVALATPRGVVRRGGRAQAQLASRDSYVKVM